MDTGNDNSAGKKFWDYLSRIASGVTLIIGAGLISHEVRIAVIESSAFTKTAAAAMEMNVLQQTKADLREIQTLVVEVRELKVIVRENNAVIQERIRDLEKRLGIARDPDNK